MYVMSSISHTGFQMLTQLSAHIGTVETSRNVETKHSHLRSYRGNPATREGKVHVFP